MGIVFSDSFNYNRVQALGIPVLLLSCSQDWKKINKGIVIWAQVKIITNSSNHCEHKVVIIVNIKFIRPKNSLWKSPAGHLA